MFADCKDELKGGFAEPAMWSPGVPTNHVLNAVNKSMFNKSVCASAKYATWDKTRQYAPFVDRLRTTAR